MSEDIDYIGDDADIVFTHAYFGPGWRHVHLDSDEVNEGTLSMTDEPGYVFANFSAKSLQVYGSVLPAVGGQPSPVTSTYTLVSDSGVVVASGTFVAPSVKTQQNKVLFWNSGVLPASPDTYTFVMNVTSATHFNPFVFDYVAVKQPGSVPDSGTPRESGHVFSSSTAPTSSTVPAAASAQATPSDKTSSRVGIIVGSVVGGTALFIVLCIALVVLKRRPRIPPRQTGVWRLTPFSPPSVRHATASMVTDITEDAKTYPSEKSRSLLSESPSCVPQSTNADSHTSQNAAAGSNVATEKKTIDYGYTLKQ